MTNPVREKSFKIVKNAKDVKINQEKIRDFCKKKMFVPKWDNFYHFNSLDYFLILDSLNFCFWNKGKRWKISYKDKKYNGYYALALCLKDFFKKKNPDLDYFSKISQEEFNSILQGGENLYFLKKRWQIVRRVSKEVIEKYGSFENFISSANKKFSVLVPKIQKLYSFDDPFLKRAQILACDIYGAGLADFDDPEYLTAFADYRVPQILNYFGILEYSSFLNNKISNNKLIAKNSNQEKEIRAATIAAIELLRKGTGNKLYSFRIDWVLWNLAQKIKIKKPYHLTKTIYY